MKTFAERKAALERLGWHASVQREYRGKPGEGRREHNMELFSGVTLPLTAKDWCRLCMSDEARPAVLRAGKKDEEGNELYEGSENISWEGDDAKVVQRKVNEWFHNGGACSIDSLVEVGDLLRGHWGDTEENAFGTYAPERLAKAVDGFIEYRDNMPEGTYIGAWGKIALMYQIVRDHYTPEVPEAPHENYPEIEAAFGTVGHMSWAFGVRELFGFSADGDTQMSATFQMMLARFLPALRTVYTKISELVPEPIEGWALIDRDAGDGEVAENGSGLCVFQTKADCEHLIRMWEQTAEEHEDEVCTPRKIRERNPIRERIGIRPVRISVADGIEFLDDGIEPKVRPPVRPERRPNWLKEPMEDVHGLFEQWVKGWTWGDRDQYPGEYDADSRAWSDAAEFFGGGRASGGVEPPVADFDLNDPHRCRYCGVNLHPVREHLGHECKMDDMKAVVDAEQERWHETRQLALELIGRLDVMLPKADGVIGLQSLRQGSPAYDGPDPYPWVDKLREHCQLTDRGPATERDFWPEDYCKTCDGSGVVMPQEGILPQEASISMSLCVKSVPDRAAAYRFNTPPGLFCCDGSATCRKSCGKVCVHAEINALLMAKQSLARMHMLHVKVVGGEAVPSGPPSCPDCSKAILHAGIDTMWLLHEDGLKDYPADEFHELSLGHRGLPVIQ